MLNTFIYADAMRAGPNGFPEQDYLIFEVREEAFFMILHVFSNIRKHKDWPAAIRAATRKADSIEKICMNEPFKVQNEAVMGGNEQFGNVFTVYNQNSHVQPF